MKSRSNRKRQRKTIRGGLTPELIAGLSVAGVMGVLALGSYLNILPDSKPPSNMSPAKYANYAHRGNQLGIGYVK